jgi:hypothetical protein
VSHQDARKLDHKTLEEMRIRAVKQVQSGVSPEEITRVLGLSHPTIYNWLASYRENYTMCALNVFGVADFWRWYQKIDMPISLGTVVDPKALSPASLPSAFRELAVAQIPAENHDFLLRARSLLQADKGVTQDVESLRLAQFWRHVDGLDRIHGTSLVSVQPIFAEIRPQAIGRTADNEA